MRFATHRITLSLLSLSLVGILAAASVHPSAAQTGGPSGPPGIDHYLVYLADPIAGTFAVALRDQFYPQPTTHHADPMRYYANPVNKNGEGIFDPTLHYTWWQINPPRPHSSVIVSENQFGQQTLNLGPAEYLWNPSLKEQPVPPIPPPPVANHYLCYRATGQFVPRTVTLQDQFGPYQATVIAPEWFCNPVDKQFQGNIEPIVRPDAHQTCYRIQVQQPFQPRTITFIDEFMAGGTVLHHQEWLCVPSFKHPVTPSEVSTWGSVKATYR